MCSVMPCPLPEEYPPRREEGQGLETQATRIAHFDLPYPITTKAAMPSALPTADRALVGNL